MICRHFRYVRTISRENPPSNVPSVSKRSSFCSLNRISTLAGNSSSPFQYNTITQDVTHNFSIQGTHMKQPGLDGRHRDQNPPKAGEIRQKRGDTLNKNLPTPIPQFSPNAKLSTMRNETGKVSERAVRQAAKNR